MAIPKRAGANGHGNSPGASTAIPPVAPRRELRTGAARSRGEAMQEVALRQQSGTLHTTTSAYGQETTQDEQLGTVQFARNEKSASVRVGFGKTLNLSNFEFLRIDVTVEMPCAPGDLHQAFEEAAGFAADKLIAEEGAWLGNGAASTAPATKHKASRR